MIILASRRAEDIPSNDKARIEYIFKEYRDLMFTKAYAILKDRPLAEDALSDAFKYIWKNIGKFDEPGGSRSIVLAVTIAKNCAYALQDGKPFAGFGDDERRGVSVKGMEQALYNMSSDEIIKAVNKLGGKNKNVFLLKYAFDFTNKKSAGTLGESEDDIEDRLYISQKKIRSLMLKNRR